MPATMKSVILALCLGVASANINAPSVSMNLKHGKFGSGLDLGSLDADFKVESKVSDDLSVGVNLDNGDSPVRSFFGKFSQKFGGGNMEANLNMGAGAKTISGDLTFTDGDNKVTANLDSGSGVDAVSYSRSGKGWSFNPTFNLKDNSVDLEASADYSDDTNLNVKVNADGSSALEVNHRLDADTSLNMQGSGADFNSMKVEVSRRLDDDNTVKPTFDMSSKHMTFSWVRKMEGGRTMTVNMDPENSIGFEVDGADDNDWSASVNSPWGNFKDADVQVGRKFNF